MSKSNCGQGLPAPLAEVRVLRLDGRHFLLCGLASPIATSPQIPEWAAVCETRARKVAALFDKRLVKFKPWEEHANLAAWRERMVARPGLK